MIRIILYNDVNETSFLMRARHATMRKVPNEDYCFSVRLYGLNRFEIERLQQSARDINKEADGG